ncbi:hypothetical protein B0H10DRAFT_2223605 [Mycena sp. CBHHK59/15]|nr:hypothetical protein B0H10DRAFT_2223605 [Mycena sp. CBHHK59/15]
MRNWSDKSKTADSKKKKRGLPTAPIIQIAPTLARPLTKKEQHNNAKKWALAHLLASTDSLFTNELVLRAHELLRMLPPWSLLTANYVQGLVNRVYGTKKDKPIHKPSKPAKFSFETPEGIAVFIEWALQKHEESGTLVFYWQTWGDGKEKKGLFLSHLIATYISNAPAIGALLLAVQAKTGMLIIPHKKEGHFSIDDWGNISIQGSDRKIKKIRCTTFFCATLTTWDDGQWQQLCTTADEWAEKKKWAIMSSHAKSEAEDLVEEEEEEDHMIIVSD